MPEDILDKMAEKTLIKMVDENTAKIGESFSDKIAEETSIKMAENTDKLAMLRQTLDGCVKREDNGAAVAALLNLLQGGLAGLQRGLAGILIYLMQSNQSVPTLGDTEMNLLRKSSI